MVNRHFLAAGENTMRLSLALGVAAAAWAVAAYADPGARIFVGHGRAAAQVDSDRDGWVTRAEAGAAADRLFDGLDGNSDGRLTSDDHRGFDIHTGHGHARMHRLLLGADAPDAEDLTEGCEIVEQAADEVPRAGRREGRRVTITCREQDGGRIEREMTILRGGEPISPEEQARIEREIERVEREVERASREAERAEHEAERLAEEAERMAEDIERRVHREVVVINGDDGDWHAALPQLPPLPPMAPLQMLFAHNGEADTNNDGALSREEFRAQQLRFFDASDANGDGRVRVETTDLPDPPEPPAAPEPPEPPRRR